MAVDELARPATSEVGAPGNTFFNGFIKTDEYVPELIGARGLDVFERMRRSDGATQATLRSMKLPLLSADWDVEPASSDPRDIEIADRFAENLFEGMSMTFIDHLRQLLTHLEFGFYVGETVWEIRRDVPAPTAVLEFVAREAIAAGATFKAPAPRTFFMWTGKFAATEPLVNLRKIAPRLQRTITKWNLARDGGLQSVTQRVYGQNPIDVEIPVSKLLVFVNEKEGANWYGKSVLRPGYKRVGNGARSSGCNS